MFILENAIGAAAREYLAHKWAVHAVPQSGDGKAPAAWSLSARVGARDRLGGEASSRHLPAERIRTSSEYRPAELLR